MKTKTTFKVSAILLLMAAGIFFGACRKERSNGLNPAQTSTQTEVLDNSTPPPSVPLILDVPAGNKLSYHTYAEGVQIYKCTETSAGVYAWVFVAPRATLYANSGLNGITGTHYAGPTWESNSGSKVVAARVQGATVDPDAIPWLLLKAVSTDGNGIFKKTTFIQRTNTTGGKAPATGANSGTVGQEVEVPYTADYYFYKED